MLFRVFQLLPPCHHYKTCCKEWAALFNFFFKFKRVLLCGCHLMTADFSFKRGFVCIRVAIFVCAKPGQGGISLGNKRDDKEYVGLWLDHREDQRRRSIWLAYLYSQGLPVWTGLCTPSPHLFNLQFLLSNQPFVVCLSCLLKEHQPSALNHWTWVASPYHGTSV